jgi:hypothetical protein
MKDQKRDDDFEISTLKDHLKDSNAQNELLRSQNDDNERMLEKFASEIR